MASARYASLYQVNTRVWLTELARALGRPATLDDIPDPELDRMAQIGPPDAALPLQQKSLTCRTF